MPTAYGNACLLHTRFIIYNYYSWCTMRVPSLLNLEPSLASRGGQWESDLVMRFLGMVDDGVLGMVEHEV